MRPTAPILPGAVLGVLGGGQLGRMFALRAREMGYGIIVLDPDADAPAGRVADRHLVAGYDDGAALDELAACCAAVTIEFENVPAASLARLAARVPVAPGAAAVAIAQDRVREKTFFQSAGLATAPFAPVSAESDISDAAATTGFPAILKTARFGYDGKGQASVRTEDEVRAAFRDFGGVPCILEGRLALEQECSVVLARGFDGSIAAFTPGANVHRDGILETTCVPADLPETTLDEAQALASHLAASLEYVGVLGVELFVAEGGRLFVNEIAPRPHNSGHWTQDAAGVCQFEQQVRAMCALPLGVPTLQRPVCMINILGDVWSGGEPDWPAALAVPGARLHLYGKREPRIGRKMGHVTVTAPTAAEALSMARRAHARLGAATRS